MTELGDSAEDGAQHLGMVVEYLGLPAYKVGHLWNFSLSVVTIRCVGVVSATRTRRRRETGCQA